MDIQKRIIKFRVWVKSKAQMDYYQPFTFDCLMSQQNSQSEAEDFIIMQYIEVNDKKRTKEYPEGQEIYEGDILISDEEDSMNKILIAEDFHEFIYEVMYSEEHSGLGGYSRKDIKVIGNIYSNPELLEGMK